MVTLSPDKRRGQGPKKSTTSIAGQGNFMGNMLTALFRAVDATVRQMFSKSGGGIVCAVASGNPSPFRLLNRV